MSKIAFQRAFQELTETEVQKLLEKSRDLIYQDGAVMMREGDDQGQIMVILAGEVRVVRLAKGGKEVDLTTPLTAGDTVGEMSFIDHMGASATLIAKGDVVVKSVDHELVQEMANGEPTFLQRFYHSLLYTVIRRLRVVDFKMTY
ncbi:cyclic nucleotide-binding domain-containing protein [Terasakiella sp. A23]|uniref:Crp/Fnr family transcriptional regulator n=1 Tax=Terasakiella sp. FCG-A23 TaxID=3080561 RepID=UPI002955CA7B|nr:cyclic nucleotide-binding domain-containing protein [Terasakiella sp. A23]MDV7340672.1 cyclic nucleotide-binding domain-containing protein [Terasakiella sp. A23]